MTIDLHMEADKALSYHKKVVRLMCALRHFPKLLNGIAVTLWMIGSALCARPMAADAANNTGDSQSIVNFYRTDEEDRSERVGDYDINENNEIAVATDEYINIYDENGKFLYGYSVSISSAYAIDFHTDGIRLYLLRQEQLIRLDDKGSVISVSSVTADDSTASEMTANMRQADKTYADCEYRLNASLTKLVKIDSNGEERLIYEASPSARAADFIFITAILLAACTIFAIFMKRRRSGFPPSNSTEDRNI